MSKKSGGLIFVLYLILGAYLINISFELIEIPGIISNFDNLVIGVGGVFSAEDAYRKIKLGANLVQLITGMVYEGPGLIGEINRGLVELMERDGYKNISEAVGKGVK